MYLKRSPWKEYRFSLSVFKCFLPTKLSVNYHLLGSKNKVIKNQTTHHLLSHCHYNIMKYKSFWKHLESASFGWCRNCARPPTLPWFFLPARMNDYGVGWDFALETIQILNVTKKWNNFLSIFNVIKQT